MDLGLLGSFAANVDWIYAGLVRQANATAGLDPERGLAGRLLYAGELEDAGSVLVVAANIAGAASLSATADVDTQNHAVRNGVIDFLVASVAEGMRIVRNAIRKHETVAVCVAQSPCEVEREMVKLGVLPDLLPPGTLNAPRYENFLNTGAQQIDPIYMSVGQTVLTWSVDRVPALWLPKLDAIALECLGSFHGLHSRANLDTWAASRWLRYAPRYLGPLAQGVRLLRCPTEVARGFLSRVQELVAARKLDVAVEITLSNGVEPEIHKITPPSNRRRSKVSAFFPAGSLNSRP
jgi:hypothetical protein